MKKSYLFLFLMTLLSISLNAQDKKEKRASSENFNEIKINGLFLVLGALDFTYEKTINEESGAGITFLIPIDDDVSDNINYSISPYYRFYFGKKYAAGFFVEGLECSILPIQKHTSITQDLIQPLKKKLQPTLP